MPRWPSGAYFTASTAARASSAVLTWGTCTPHAPRSRNGAMISGLFPTGRTMGAMPVSSAAAIQASAVSTVMEPCSLSRRIPSDPRWPRHLDHRWRGEGAHDAEGGFPVVEPLLEGVLAHGGASILRRRALEIPVPARAAPRETTAPASGPR